MKLKEIDFSSLDPREMGLWPMPLRILMAFAAACVTIAAVYFFYLVGRIELLNAQHVQEEQKRNEFKDKYNKATNLASYEQQMEEINTQYSGQLMQMPQVGNIPELLNFITKLAAKNGLHIESIVLGEPTNVEGFYENMKLDLSIVGTYHNIGKFMADLSKLSRIVTLHSFVLKPQQGDAKADALYLTLTTKAYWLAPADTTKKEDAPPADTNAASDASAMPAASEDTVEVETVPDNMPARRRPGSPQSEGGE